ncbi:MAG: CHAT domain-containing protein [Rubrivivax sp.]|nr:CHAT domain-containing protein [Rubrivivax sp.]
MARLISQTDAVRLFYIYAHEDEQLRDELADHLMVLQRRGLILPWHDRKTVPGQCWNSIISEMLESAELVLLLISKDFLASDYIFGVELKRAMERFTERACDVVPIFVRSVNIEPEDAEDFPFMRLQGLPTDLKPVTSWAIRDEAWTNVAIGLRARVKTIRDRRAHSSDALELRFSLEYEPDLTPPFTSDANLSQRHRATSESTVSTMSNVVARVVEQVDKAEMERCGHAVFDSLRQTLMQETAELIDLPDQKRILWVDDRPESHRYERTALAKLQIEVIVVGSTGEALLRVELESASRDVFDLVLTDWTRLNDSEDAGLALIEALRNAGHRMPVVVYHRESEVDRRADHAARSLAAGAFGDAVRPSDLIRLVHRALVKPRVSNHVLVVGDPQLSGWGAFEQLPGAEEEARQVARVFEEGLGAPAVHALLGATQASTRAITSALHARPWRVMHLAAHGVHRWKESDEQPERSGMIIGKRVFLQPGDLKQLRHVPELMFVSCSLGDEDFLQASHRYESVKGWMERTAGSLANDLLGVGLRCVVVACSVSHEDARTVFARKFYEALISGMRFADAVARAADASLRLEDNTGVVVYRSCGDPDWTL